MYIYTNTQVHVYTYIFQKAAILGLDVVLVVPGGIGVWLNFHMCIYIHKYKNICTHIYVAAILELDVVLVVPGGVGV